MSTVTSDLNKSFPIIFYLIESNFSDFLLCGNDNFDGKKGWQQIIKFVIKLPDLGFDVMLL